MKSLFLGKKMSTTVYFSLFQVWFKNRRAKCRQQGTPKPSASRPSTPAKAKQSKSSPSAPASTLAPTTNLPTTSASSQSPPMISIKRESPQMPAYRNNGNLTPMGSNASSSVTTPSPPMTPSSNPPLTYQYDTYNSFNWHTNGHSSSPHYYGQGYNPAYYSHQMDYFNQQGVQNQMSMGHNMNGGAYQMAQMAGYPGMMPHIQAHQNQIPQNAQGGQNAQNPTQQQHGHQNRQNHQNYSPDHPDCNMDFNNHQS